MIDFENEDDERKQREVPFTAKKSIILHSGINKNTEQLIFVINSELTRVGSHFRFNLQNEFGGKIFISGGSCGLIHYRNVSDNLLRIVGCALDTIIHKDIFLSGMHYVKVMLNLIFIPQHLLGSIFKTKRKRQLEVSGVMNPATSRAVFPIKCSFIATFANLI